MAHKLKPDDVKMWQERIDRSLTWRKPEEDKWKRYIGYAQGMYDRTGDPNYISVNLVHSHVRIIIPAVYSKNPDIVIIPRRKDFEEQARVMEVLLRYLVKELNLKGEMKSCILDAILIGHSWIKVGYEASFIKDQEKIPMIQKALESFQQLLKGEEPGEYDESTYSIQPDERIVDQRPWALRVAPKDVIVPAFSANRYELPWIAHRFVRRMKDVKNNPRYKNVKTLRPSSKAVDLLKDNALPGPKQSGVQPDEFDEFSVLYEIWDCTENCIYTIADDHDKPLEIRPNEFTFLDSRHVFEMLGFNFLPDKFYPMSEIEPWEPQIEELNQIRTQQSIHRKRYNRRYIYVDGAFTPESIKKIEDGEDGVMAPTTAEDARTALAAVEDAELPRDVYVAEQAIKEDITTIGGVTDYQRGSAEKGARSATEASIVESQSRFRSDERLDIVGDFAQRVIRNLGMIAQNFMDQEQMIPILGDDVVKWQKVDKKTIQGEFVYDLVFGSTAAINRDTERQQYIQVYELMAQDPLFDPIKVRMEMVRKLGFTNPASWMRPDIAAMMKQAEMQAIQDSMVNAEGAVPGSTGGGNGTAAAGSMASVLAGMKKRMGTRIPGGRGGGGPGY